MTEAWQRQRFFQVLGRAVLGATVADAGQPEAVAVGNAARPLLLFLDDVQWCDRDTLDWLHFLTRLCLRPTSCMVSESAPIRMAPVGGNKKDAV